MGKVSAIMYGLGRHIMCIKHNASFIISETNSITKTSRPGRLRTTYHNLQSFYNQSSINMEKGNTGRAVFFIFNCIYWRKKEVYFYYFVSFIN